MITINDILAHIEAQKSKVSLVVSDKPSHHVINQIDEQIKEINELGGTKKVVRIVITSIADNDWEKVIYLQSDDNGDKATFVIAKQYPYTKSLVEGLSVYCQANDLTYSNF